jgi:formylglycine-generating enzyme
MNGLSPSRRRSVVVALLVAIPVGAVAGCDSCVPDPPRPADAGLGSGAEAEPGDAAEADASPDEPDGASDEPDAAQGALDAGSLLVCPPEMVRVAGRLCVDRHEGMLAEVETARPLSPYYPPTRKMAAFVEKLWTQERLVVGDEDARARPLPPLPVWQKQSTFEVRAVSRQGVVPQGYVSGVIAEQACKNAKKRLCTLDEWRTACRGERDLPFPYGDAYVGGKCNVFREGHPAAILHDDASKGHTDPRLNLVSVNGKPLLRKTGTTPSCMSEWEGDAIADMVGNLDEWIDDPEGTFLGGFFSRSNKLGCAATITGHNFDYFDYSTGIRCCKDAAPPAAD